MMKLATLSRQITFIRAFRRRASMRLARIALLSSVTALLMACGGGGSGGGLTSPDGGGGGGGSGSQPTPTPTPTPNPEGPTPSSTPPPDPNPTELTKPQLQTTVLSGQVAVSWSPTAAANHRILVWFEDDVAPQEYSTESFSYDVPISAAGRHLVIVEAYDALGNSLFSDPAVVEVSQ